MPPSDRTRSRSRTARRPAIAATLVLELLLVALAFGVAQRVEVGGDAQRTPVANLLGPDFVDIRSVPSGPAAPATAPGAATGTFTWDCGRNENGHRNTANIVMAPGFPGQPHHVHDYVGNVSTAVNSTPRTLAAAATTCPNGDRSTYFWPVLRTVAAVGAVATDGAGATGEATGHPGHEGEIQVPVEVALTFTGNPRGNVVAMPQQLAGTVGDAVAVTNGGANAAATWTCASTPERRTTRYPACPAGDRVLRVYDFPSCWDGRRTDSESHRAHLVFPTGEGACSRGTFPVPRLRMTLAYDLPPGVRFQIDAFDGQRNSPLTDHAFFVNLMPEPLMAKVVTCLNSGQTCREG
ncbi:DUF1996 domain-containing protein [Micromonospora sp. WP24]|uniref:DUF1996 domain-containing protein n=1 Tax=Micromonospora sp. WP24 TaxID=2604469 RepID=UPI0011D5D0DC|nr:DUF1996 domain-containing protein [Micromonospora sp. WP24]TYB95409.1 DUF1996 domain-containing protein [Micromonospora sp. WP24]